MKAADDMLATAMMNFEQVLKASTMPERKNKK
jgi:hypothetical protein